MSEFRLNFPGPGGQQIEQSIEPGNIMFLVGANGTGKSTLMHKFATQNSNRVRKITAHRQVWFNSNTIDITPAGREQTERQITSRDTQPDSRWKDDYAAQRTQVTIFDLIDAENIEARRIANEARSGNMDVVAELAAAQAPMAKMNDILKVSNLDIQIKIDKASKIIAVRAGYPDFSVAELSDGERNAILIIANVLTAQENSLILLDEPERHLHRSIVSPLLSTLLTYRPDCGFVISTHDVSLPIDHAHASCLLVRSYSHTPQSWITDYIESVRELDEETATAVLGSRRSVLFIEGKPSSLDMQIYQILFPEISVKPSGSCVDVERAVKGLKSTEGNHWVDAFGIIDRDNRSDAECEQLLKEGIAPLEQYSVESIYYHNCVVEGVLKRVAEINGLDSKKALEEARSGVVKSILEHKDRMVCRLIERRIKDKVLYETPNWKEIQKGNIEVRFSASDILKTENDLIDKLLGEQDIGALIARYPVRETPALESIINALGFQSQDKYEQAVRKMLCDSEEERNKVLEIIKPITNLLLSEDHT